MITHKYVGHTFKQHPLSPSHNTFLVQNQRRKPGKM